MIWQTTRTLLAFVKWQVIQVVLHKKNASLSKTYDKSKNPALISWLIFLQHLRLLALRSFINELLTGVNSSDRLSLRWWYFLHIPWQLPTEKPTVTWPLATFMHTPSIWRIRWIFSTSLPFQRYRRPSMVPGVVHSAPLKVKYHRLQHKSQL